MDHGLVFVSLCTCVYPHCIPSWVLQLPVQKHKSTQVYSLVSCVTLWLFVSSLIVYRQQANLIVVVLYTHCPHYTCQQNPLENWTTWSISYHISTGQWLEDLLLCTRAVYSYLDSSPVCAWSNQPLVNKYTCMSCKSRTTLLSILLIYCLTTTYISVHSWQFALYIFG